MPNPDLEEKGRPPQHFFILCGVGVRSVESALLPDGHTICVGDAVSCNTNFFCGVGVRSMESALLPDGHTICVGDTVTLIYTLWCRCVESALLPDGHTICVGDAATLTSSVV